MSGLAETVPPSTTTVQDDAVNVLDAMASGGMAILPLDVAYAVIGTHPDAIRRLFAVKQRDYAKPSGMFATWEMSREIHIMPTEHHAIARVIVEEYDLPFSIVAPFRTDHELLRKVDPFVMQSSSKGGTLDMLINAGPWHDAVARLGVARGMAVFGSSANRSLSGSKYRLQDIEPELREAAAIEIDGGTARYANPEGKSSTIIDFRDFHLVRHGVCSAQLITIFAERFGIALH